MFATIQSEQFLEFSVRVKKANPIKQIENYKIYELVDSMYPNDIIVKNKSKNTSKIYRYIAIDDNNIGYLYDINSGELEVKIGPCKLKKDSFDSK